jgi:predicted nucleic acid-binding protein
LTAFFDTSALLSVVLGETTAPQVRQVLADHEIVVASAIAAVEARAGLARARRGRRLTARREREAWTRFERMWLTSAILDVDRPLLSLAIDLAAAHGLRGYDAVQLASGLRAADVTGVPGFACLDGDLNAAAAAEGLTCLLT